ncbi:cytoplasmic tyrosine-protein kinase BMX-like [Patiria miniata]|uniref:Tyrosine-protein kinase n=1 Tax=Patiria miniata TaxID=46514 RepID=A0A913ZUC1_PATMI|nr:cytoplasmic tyrosine-protein kinase BMX-like [Patiria miniata]
MADEIKEVCRVGMMLKRSQNKRKLAPVNFRNRLFVLTRDCIAYYEGTSEKQGKEKGRINFSDIKVVEEVDDTALEKPYGIQISYEDYTLYFFASSQQEQKEWLSDLQIACKNNITLQNRFHSGIHNTKTWTCCEQKHVGAPGCKDSFKHRVAQLPPTPTPRIAPSTSSLPPSTHRQQGPYNGQVAHKPRGYTTPASHNHHLANPATSVSARSLSPSRSTPYRQTPSKSPTYPQPPSPSQSPTYRQEQNRLNIPLPKPPPEIPKKEDLIVIAKFDYEPMEDVDISLVRGEEYSVIDNSREYWWKARNKRGQVGYIPSNYVEEKSKFASGLEKYEWFTGKWNRQRTEQELKGEGKDGCFMVRNSSTKGLYTLSVLTKAIMHGQDDNVSHYHIKPTAGNQYYVSDKHCFNSIPELIEYHRLNSGGLITRLRNPPGHIPPTTAGLGSGTLEITWKELSILHELGSGQFGVVKLAKIKKNNHFVAVKIMRENAMSEDDFIDEAKVMTQLQHENLVQLYGVCKNPICIITEFMSKGCLLSYIRRHQELLDKPNVLCFMAIQICSALAYLEQKKFIHRDLAARNCLVGERNLVKVADFGLTRYVLDDEYTSTGTKFPIKWAPPEVLHFTKFSSKSDVWAFGILLWEIFSGGKLPYPTMNNVQVVDQVTRHHYRMDIPEKCPRPMYNIMYRCWHEKPEKRPSFADLKQMLVQLQDQDSTDFIQ